MFGFILRIFNFLVRRSKSKKLNNKKFLKCVEIGIWGIVANSLSLGDVIKFYRNLYNSTNHPKPSSFLAKSKIVFETDKIFFVSAILDKLKIGIARKVQEGNISSFATYDGVLVHLILMVDLKCSLSFLNALNKKFRPNAAIFFNYNPAFNQEITIFNFLACGVVPIRIFGENLKEVKIDLDKLKSDAIREISSIEP